MIFKDFVEGVGELPQDGQVGRQAAHANLATSSCMTWVLRCAGPLAHGGNTMVASMARMLQHAAKWRSNTSCNGKGWLLGMSACLPSTCAATGWPHVSCTLPHASPTPSLPRFLQQIVFDYTAYNESASSIDSSYRKGQPAQTQLGIQGLIPGGWEDGMGPRSGCPSV